MSDEQEVRYVLERVAGLPEKAVNCPEGWDELANANAPELPDGMRGGLTKLGLDFYVLCGNRFYRYRREPVSLRLGSQVEAEFTRRSVWEAMELVEEYATAMGLDDLAQELVERRAEMPDDFFNDVGGGEADGSGV